MQWCSIWIGICPEPRLMYFLTYAKNFWAREIWRAFVAVPSYHMALKASFEFYSCQMYDKEDIFCIPYSIKLIFSNWNNILIFRSDHYHGLFQVQHQHRILVNLIRASREFGSNLSIKWSFFVFTEWVTD